jgi:hypothetical protein
MGKEGVSQGQAKVKEMQAKKASDEPAEQADAPATSEAPATPDAPAGNYSLDDV